jgi:transcriptional regulator with XRE-family HTH domain
MDKREKIIELIRYYAEGSQANFCRMTGLGTTTVSRIVTGNIKPTDKHLLKIASAIPDARPFLEGEISLPKKNSVVEQLAEKEAEIVRLREEIALKNRVIEALLAKGGF